MKENINPEEFKKGWKPVDSAVILPETFLKLVKKERELEEKMKKNQLIIDKIKNSKEQEDLEKSLDLRMENRKLYDTFVYFQEKISVVLGEDEELRAQYELWNNSNRHNEILKIKFNETPDRKSVV
jgi:hypothetical protein